MKTIAVKSIFLFCLLAFLCMLLFHYYHYKKDFPVTIIDKYYSNDPSVKERGIKSGKLVSFSRMKAQTEACAMEFSNGEILQIDCETYLNYKIGEKVFIRYKEDELLKIRRKE